MKIKKAVILVLCLVCVLAAVLLLRFRLYIHPGLELLATPHTSSLLLSEDVGRVRQLVSKAVKLKTPEKAYESIKYDFSEYSLGVQHDVAHIFGEELAGSVGLEGLSVCDDQMANGCYHGFLLKWIAENGIESVSELGQICLNEGSTACEHGIGHGIAEYYGEDQLIAQLTLCSTLTWKKPVFGCAGGAIMEYFFPVSRDGSVAAWQLRPYEFAEKYQPCSQLEGRADDTVLAGCVFQLPQWWKSVVTYPEMSQLCDSAGQLAEGSDQLLPEWCFRGVGFTATRNFEFDQARVLSACSEMESAQAQEWCRLGAVWGFQSGFTEIDQQEKWQLICPERFMASTPEGAQICAAEADTWAMAEALPDLQFP